MNYLSATAARCVCVFSRSVSAPVPPEVKVSARTFDKLQDRLCTLDDARPYADVQTDSLLIDYAKLYWQ